MSYYCHTKVNSPGICSCTCSQFEADAILVSDDKE